MKKKVKDRLIQIVRAAIITKVIHHLISHLILRFLFILLNQYIDSLSNDEESGMISGHRAINAGKKMMARVRLDDSDEESEDEGEESGSEEPEDEDEAEAEDSEEESEEQSEEQKEGGEEDKGNFRD